MLARQNANQILIVLLHHAAIRIRVLLIARLQNAMFFVLKNVNLGQWIAIREAAFARKANALHK